MYGNKEEITEIKETSQGYFIFYHNAAGVRK